MLDDRKRWMEEQTVKANEYVDTVLALAEKSAKIGQSAETLNTSSALARIEDALPLQIAPTLTPTEHKAAMLLGKGLAFDEVESNLCLDTGAVYLMHQRSPEFRRAYEYYMTVDEEELGGRVRQEIRVMLDREDIEDKTRATILALAQKIGASPWTRKMELADRILKKESIEATKESNIHPGRLIGVQTAESVDADFEIVA